MTEQKIGYGQLSNSLKALVIIGWIAFGLWALMFLTGFIMGVMGL